MMGQHSRVQDRLGCASSNVASGGTAWHSRHERQHVTPPNCSLKPDCLWQQGERKRQSVALGA
jgi:hypothetical protein